MTMTWKGWLSRAAVAGGVALGTLASTAASAQETIKVGILHSLSGTMAISERRSKTPC